MIEHKTSKVHKEYIDVSEMNVVEILKNLVGSKDNQPKGQLILKHLSPLHNPRATRDVDTVSQTSNELIETVQQRDQTLC
jgi:hypothetical protein